jgi:hypothetical protein
VPQGGALLQLEFDSLEKAAKAVPLIVDCGADACELMGRELIKIARESFGQYRDILNPASAASLLVEHTGRTTEEVRQKIEKTILAVGILAFNSTSVFDTAVQKRLWKCRKDAAVLLCRKHQACRVCQGSAKNR